MAAASAERLIKDVGKRLAQSRLNKDALVKLLKQAAGALSEFVQSPSLQSALEPVYNSIAKHNLLGHKDKDVKLLVAVCFSEIIRILAPDPPFSDDLLKDIFKLFISTFGELGDTASPYFTRRVKILETVARVRCCVLMLDIGCNDLVVDMFDVFFSVIRDEHPQSLLQSVLSIMTLILEEEVTQPLLDVILQNLLKEEKNVPPAAYKLAVSVIQNCMEKLEPFVRRFLTLAIINKGTSDSEHGDFYHEIIFEIFQCAPQMLLAVIPSLTQELLTDQVDVRIKAVQLLGRLFSLPGCQAAHEYHQLFVEFLKRFSDISVEVRLAAIECAKGCYMANPSGVEALEILGAVEARLLDFDDKVRIQVVNIICDLAQCHPRRIPSEVVLHATERLRDKKVSVRKNTMQKLLELYMNYCKRSFQGEITPDDNFEQIPSRILRLCYDKDCKDFKPQNMELAIVENLFPASLPVADRVRHWISIFSFFASPHKKALESIISQKWRLQTVMQEYLALRQKEKEDDSDVIREGILASFKKMSNSFVDSVKAEENFQSLHQMKDNNIFKALKLLLDEQKDLEAARTIRDDLLKRIGSRHPQYEFLKTLSLKCSCNLFNAEHVHCLLLHCLSNNIGENRGSLAPAIDLLLTVVSISPAILRGSEEDFLKLLLQVNNTLKDKLLQILSRAGSHMSIEFHSIFPSLEKQCLEGTRSQAKHSVPAIIAFADASREPALETLFGQLLDSLYAGKNLPTVLQSLGTLAQHRMTLFETQEEEITRHIIEKIFGSSTQLGGDVLDEDPSCSYLSKVKTYALKALSKSFLPFEGNRPKQKLVPFLAFLLKIVSVGEVSDSIKLSENDKAHVRLAAAVSVLRLARRWDLEISPQLFHAVIQRAKDPSDLVQRSFIKKINKFLKSRSLPRKYACAFAIAASGCSENFSEDCVKYILEFIEDYRREARNRQASAQSSGATMTYYPEYTLAYLIHLLAHDPLFPGVDCQDDALFAKICSPLFILLQALITSYPADDNKKESTESISFILSILRAIKMSEDAVDENMNTNLRILADIGLVITESLGGSDLLAARAFGKVLLPSSFYKVKDDVKSRNEEGNCLPKCIANGSFIEKIRSDWSHLVQPFVSFAKKSKRLQEDILHVEDAKSQEKLASQKQPFPAVNGDDNETELPGGRKEKSKTSIDEVNSTGKFRHSLRSTTVSSKLPALLASSDGTVGEIVSTTRKGEHCNPVMSKRLVSNSHALGGASGHLRENCYTSDAEHSPQTENGLRSDNVDVDLQSDSHKMQQCGNIGEALVGQRIKIWSPFEKCYCTGIITEFNHLNCSHMIEYDNGEVERLCLTNERWEIESKEPIVEKGIKLAQAKTLEDLEGADAEPSPHDVRWGSSLSSDAGDKGAHVLEESAEEQPPLISSVVENLDSTLSSFIGLKKATKKQHSKPPIKANAKKRRL